MSEDVLNAVTRVRVGMWDTWWVLFGETALGCEAFSYSNVNILKNFLADKAPSREGKMSVTCSDQYRTK